MKESNCYAVWNRLVNILLQIFFVLLLVFGFLSKRWIELFVEVSDVHIPFLAASIFLNLVLAKLILVTIRFCDITFDRFEILCMALLTAAAFLVCLFSVKTRNHAYYWDEVEGYIRYFWIDDWFGPGALSGFRFLFDTVRSDFKGWLATVFMAVPFAFTDKTQDSWCLSIFFNMIPALAVMYAVFLKSILKRLPVADRKAFFVLDFVGVFFMPLFYTFLDGYLELFSVVFALMACSLVMNIQPENKNYKKWAMVGAVTVIMVMVRDFYIIWAVSFFSCYAGISSLKFVRDKQYGLLKKWLLRMCIMGVLAAGAALAVLWPFVQNYFKGSDGRDNSFWVFGGLMTEIQLQIGFLGKWFVLVILAGCIGGLFFKELRMYALFAVSHGAGTLWIFHKFVTLSGKEHSVVLIPFYMMGTALGVCVILRLAKARWLRSIVCNLFILLSVCNLLFSLAGGKYYTKIFSNLSLELAYDQTEQIKETADWLEGHLKDGETAYFIPHWHQYNPDKFRYINMPDRKMTELMPYGSAVLGFHEFPTGLLDAKYVLTMEPFHGYSIAEKYNDAFLGCVKQYKKFRPVETFDMGDGYKIMVYERMEKADIQEVDYYRKLFADENKKYPVLYEKVFEKYVNEKLIP